MVAGPELHKRRAGPIISSSSLLRLSRTQLSLNSACSRGLDGLSEDTLARWTEDSLATGKHRLRARLSGQTLLIRTMTDRLVIRLVWRGVRKWISTLMLRTRHALRPAHGLSRRTGCYGMLRNRYLVWSTSGRAARYSGIGRSRSVLCRVAGAHQDIARTRYRAQRFAEEGNLLLVNGQHRACSTSVLPLFAIRVRAVQPRSFPFRRAPRFQPVAKAQVSGPL